LKKGNSTSPLTPISEKKRETPVNETRNLSFYSFHFISLLFLNLLFMNHLQSPKLKEERSPALIEFKPLQA